MTWRVYWRARLVLTGPRAMGRFEAVTRELARAPRIDEPVHDYRPGAGGVAFDMFVTAVSEPDAVVTARQALTDALASAGVGAPHPPAGTDAVPVAVVLEERPYVEVANGG